MLKVFVDTDICIDLLSGREPFVRTAQKLFSAADRGIIKICVSSLSFSNIDYVLRSKYSGAGSRQLISRFKTLVTVLSVDSKTIDLAISSDFSDFEDAIQYHTAIEHGIQLFLTRNIRDYKKAKIKVMNPEAFLHKMIQ